MMVQRGALDNRSSRIWRADRPPNGHPTATLSRPGHVKTAKTFQHPQWTAGLLRDRPRDAGLDESRFRQIMAVLGVRGRVLDGHVEDLSHGQQKKVDLARTLLAEAHLLLWDEP